MLTSFTLDVVSAAVYVTCTTVSQPSYTFYTFKLWTESVNPNRNCDLLMQIQHRTLQMP